MSWQAMRLSMELAGATAVVLLVIGLPVAYGIAFSRRPWTPLMESLVALPIVLPPTVLGFYVLLALGPRSPLGMLVHSWGGAALPFTFQGLLIGSVLYSFPFAVQPFIAALRALDPRLLQASELLGASRAGTFFRVILPLCRGGIVTGAALSFAHTLGEFGVVLMVGGDIPGVTRTLSIQIYDDVQALRYGAANETSLVLLVVSFVILALVYGLHQGFNGGPSRRTWPSWPVR